MTAPTEENYGNWPSSISETLVAGKTPRISEPKLLIDAVGDQHCYWLQTLPQERGRSTIMRQTVHKNGDVSDTQSLLVAPLSAQSKAHEYGGGVYCIGDHVLYFVDANDQRIYALSLSDIHQAPKAITPCSKGTWRFADLSLNADQTRLIAVCEAHSTCDHEANFNAATFDEAIFDEAIAHIAYIDIASQETQFLSVPQADFYSNPNLSPCGHYLTYLAWHHPNMPWDTTCIYVAKLTNAGEVLYAACVKGQTNNESVFQPQWAPNGDLYCVSDSNNWWNIYKLDHLIATQESTAINNSDWQAITQLDAEFATPQWVFGMRCYAFLDADTLLTTYTQQGRWFSATVNNINTNKPVVNELNDINASYTDISTPASASIYTTPNNKQFNALFIGANAAKLPQVYALTLSELTLPKLTLPKENEKDNNPNACQITLTALGDHQLLLDKNTLSFAQSFSFTTGVKHKTPNVNQAYGFYYPPAHPDFTSVNTAIKPPVMVLCHGGPTGATSTAFNPKIQYWTSRGFAVLDVNYRGSTGFGRQYRQSLQKLWGLACVEDMCAAKNHAIKQGYASEGKSIIKGSSAGGYTVLAALTFTNEFDIGVSLYGIGNLESLASDTHKFESRYLDSLIGPYPQSKANYIERSPIHFCENITCPVLLYQGLKDKVVPPNQAQTMVDKLALNAVPTRYYTYENEGHGFRDAQNITHMLITENAFYLEHLNLKVNM